MVVILFCTAVLLAVQWISPFWWWNLVVPFLFGMILLPSFRKAFLVGLISGGLAWLSVSLYLLLTSADVIAMRIAEMLSLPSPAFLVIITTGFAMITAGFAAGTGYLLRDALMRR